MKEETRLRWHRNQWAVHLDWIQPGKSPRSEYTKGKRVHAQGISPYMSHIQGSEKVPGSTLKPLNKKEKKNLVDKTTNKSVFMAHKQQSCSTCRTSHQREREKKKKGVFLFKIPMDKRYSPTSLSAVSTIQAKLWQHRSFWYARGEIISAPYFLMLWQEKWRHIRLHRRREGWVANSFSSTFSFHQKTSA